MPRHRSIQNTFTSGELDPLLHERFDHPLYAAGCSLMEGWFLKPQGALTRRFGSKHAGLAKNDSAQRLIPFIFSITQAVMLEFGNLYIRFWVLNGQLVDDEGDPIELVSPYETEDIADIWYIQSRDTMILLHPNIRPHEIQRISATEWRIQPITFNPPPTEEAGFKINQEITLSAKTGKGITITVPNNLFTESDDNRVLREDRKFGNGHATLTSITSATEAVATVTQTFSSTTLEENTSRLLGTPVANLSMTNESSLGSIIRLTLQRNFNLNNPNLLANGDFSGGLASWTDNSGGVVTSGTNTAGSDDEDLIDSTASFLSDGVRAGHRAINTTDSEEDTIIQVISDTHVVTSVGGATFAVGEGYSIQKTGSVSTSSIGAALDGGTQGLAWISQEITVVDGMTYRVTFNTLEQPVSAMVSKTAGAGDLMEEFSYPVKNRNVMIFTADGTSAVIEFRNNQPVRGIVAQVSVQRFNIAGWRSSDVGSFVHVNGGIVEIIEVEDDYTVLGVVRYPLNDTVTALKGGWTLETPVWSNSLGWPKVGCFLGSHLFLTATETFPTRVWFNQLFGLYDFARGTADDMGGSFQIAATEVNGNQWIIGEKVLLIGTEREEITVRGSVGLTITPTSIETSSPTKIGSAAIQPLRTQRAVLFVQRGRRRLRESSFAEGVGEDRQNSDRSLYAEHLTAKDQIKRIAYQQEPVPIIWELTDGGNLYGMSYLLDQKIYGWGRFPITGASVRDIGVMPHQDGDRDRLWLLLDRGTGPPHIEYLDDSEGFYGYSMYDASVHGVFDPKTTTISGLEHLEGKSVSVMTDGFQHPNKTVVMGNITLDYPAEIVEVGLPFTPKIISLRPVYGDTPLTGLALSTSRLTVSVKDTNNLVVNGQRLTFSENNSQTDTALPLHTGIKDCENLGWDTDGVVTIEQDMPYPVTLLGIFRTLEIEEP